MSLKDRVWELMQSNRRHCGDYQYTVPSPDSYPYQWLWDSCFHAVILTHFSPDDAKREIRSLLAHQFTNGLLPHISYWERGAVLDVDWGVPGTSALTQPPIIAYAVSRIHEVNGDTAFLTEVYPALRRYYERLLTRDTRGHHLVGIINPDESGEDNSPRFDLPLDLPPRHNARENYEKRAALFARNRACNFDTVDCMSNFFWVKDVAFNCYLIENLDILAALAEKLGNADGRSHFTRQADFTRQAMRRFMFEKGLFWNIFGLAHHKVRVRTWALFAPLIGNVFTEKEARDAVTHHLTDANEFWSTYPIPTTALDETAYDPNEPAWGKAWQHPHWRGPVWMAPNWFIARGLRAYGFEEEAAHIAKRSAALIEKSGFREYFHPRTGVGMGARDFTWGGLALDMERA